MSQTKQIKGNTYCPDLFSYQRYLTREVAIGDTPLGGTQPIRIQSMTTTDTMDTQATVAQAIRMIEAGCEYIRITAPSKKEAENLAAIQNEIRKAGYQTPLIADIHFTPNAAEIAARIVSKVRINPGNYADKKKFEQLDYSDAQYNEELDKIRAKFSPLIAICKEEGTAMRIGTNHGSLSDRIMSRYGDTPMGMVESAMEFIRFCEEENFYDLVISMKASNPQVMVQAYRLLVNQMMQNGQNYPLHLGVTEAGDGEDGRIKSAVGIGALLEDGLGDTVRVSLTEDPEEEIPVARKLINRYATRNTQTPIEQVAIDQYQPFQYHKSITKEVAGLGGNHSPVVISDFREYDINNRSHLTEIGYHYNPNLDKYTISDTAPDFVHIGNQKYPEIKLPGGLRLISSAVQWHQFDTEQKLNTYPCFSWDEWTSTSESHPQLNILEIQAENLSTFIPSLKTEKRPFVILLSTANSHTMAQLRQALLLLQAHAILNPVLFWNIYHDQDIEQVTISASADLGPLFIDGFGQGIGITTPKCSLREANSIAFGILQATRTRITKTEYISCPSCGRTLFDLQETTAMIRSKTNHLKGLKIGIMGCIVNGPGEMADADYGYVGSGVGKITLYRGQEVVKRQIDAAEALDELIQLIKNDGNWVDA